MMINIVHPKNKYTYFQIMLAIRFSSICGGSRGRGHIQNLLKLCTIVTYIVPIFFIDLALIVSDF